MQVNRLVPRYLFVSLFLITVSGCGWRKTMTFPSPSHKAAIEVLQRPLANELGILVQFVSSERKITLYERRREAFVNFVHVYWSQDQTTVGVFAAGSLSFGVALDTRSGKEVAFQQVEPDIRQSIRNTYHLADADDPLQWAWSSAGATAFAKLHPRN
jgi:hypothetical protein